MPTSDNIQLAGTAPLTPYWKSECGRAVIYLGDNVEVMGRMSPDYFHAIVTDPPYGLEFMGEEWDAPWKKEAGMNSSQSEDTTGRGTWAFGGTPSSQARPDFGNKKRRRVDQRHRRQADCDRDSVSAKFISHNVEYVRDSYLYQEWFLLRAIEMLRVAKPGAHLLSFGGTRMWHRTASAIEDAGWDIRDTVMWVYGKGFPKGRNISKDIDRTLGVTREVKDVKKRSSSLGGNLNAENVGSGGFGFKDEWGTSEAVTEEAKKWEGWNTVLKPAHEPIVLARKTPNGTVAENTMRHGCGGLNVGVCVVGEDGGTRAIAGSAPNYGNNVYGVGMGGNPHDPDYVNGRYPPNFIHDGSAEVIDLLPPGGAKFFYSSKADASDRPHGADPEVLHPTVKPLDLMKYLVRLVAAKGAVVLDPFMGSGSTGCAAVEEGMWFVGVEQDEKYASIAVGKLRLALEKCGSVVRLETGQQVRRSKDTPPRPKKWRG